ncbi:glycosyltransferase family 2 protein, partial [Piromyces sp. E2]
WTLISKILTFWAIPPVRACFGVGKNKDIVQAWREKISLCIIIFCCWLLMAFFTIGIQPLFCPDESQKTSYEHDSSELQKYLHYNGQYYSLNSVNNLFKKYDIKEISNDFGGSDITPLFRECPGSESVDCNGGKNIVDPCKNYIKDNNNNCEIVSLNNKKFSPGYCINNNLIKNQLKADGKITYQWQYLEKKIKPVTVYNGIVLKDIDEVSKYSFSEDALTLLRDTMYMDGTRYFERKKEYREIAQCLMQSRTGGYVGKETVGCMFSKIITMVMTIAILGVVLTRFVMAIIFSWFVSSKLVQGHGRGGPRELYTICLVTAYSEGEEGIRCTLNSLATTTYPDKKQLLFVIADGIIVGSGNDRSTPDICVAMIIEDPKLGKAEPKSYFAIADGAKQHNMARVHAGYYIVDGHRVPAIVVVKCGTPAEASAAKPGNRGKRDSQLLLMNFLSRVTFDDRMTPLDYDLFKKIQHLCGVTPDKFEIVLMVDADTKVLPTSLSYLIAAMVNDPLIMGVCGETRIANKTTSWVTWIQVFEYYISHHLGKCFESLFGGVTCLPGCFCMYRIKAPKPGSPNTYVPVLANPDIVEDYSENIVDTLHKKNLLLLGEDRFLTTLMLRTFPKRKMIFVPQALCKTIVPDEFKVLLSQRRRWINSTVHNLMELVLVRDLCGTFCFSMQFVVGMELFGTAVLPAAIVFTVYLLVDLVLVIMKAQKESQNEPLKYVWEHGPVMPIIMLFCVLGLPGVLVMLTSQKIIYVLWMFVYLFGLPVWNFILPVYAYWHFDDFSWGETRKVQGDNGDDHSKKEGVFNASSVPLKRWHEYEKE